MPDQTIRGDDGLHNASPMQHPKIMHVGRGVAVRWRDPDLVADGELVAFCEVDDAVLVAARAVGATALDHGEAAREVDGFRACIADRALCDGPRQHRREDVERALEGRFVRGAVKGEVPAAAASSRRRRGAVVAASRRRRRRGAVVIVMALRRRHRRGVIAASLQPRMRGVRRRDVHTSSSSRRRRSVLASSFERGSMPARAPRWPSIKQNEPGWTSS